MTDDTFTTKKVQTAPVPLLALDLDEAAARQWSPLGSPSLPSQWPRLDLLSHLGHRAEAACDQCSCNDSRPPCAAPRIVFAVQAHRAHGRHR